MVFCLRQSPLSYYFTKNCFFVFELSFSFYGFKAILALYIKNYLGFTEDDATALIHLFIFFSYFTPLMGGFLADSVLGKFWTIFILSLIYVLGQVTVSVTAINGVTGRPPHWYGCAIGLFLVGLGTGGIKPCVSSFGGDQIGTSQPDLLTTFFALFYFSINFGSTISSFVTPIVRNSFGYATAFAIPATLLVVATILFTIGKRWYTIAKLRGNPYGNFFKTLFVRFSSWLFLSF